MLLLGNKYPWWCQALPLVRNQMVSRLTWWCHNCYDRKHQLSGTAARILLLIVLYQLCMVHIPSIKQPAGICIFPELGSLAAYLLCQSWPFDEDYYANSTSISLRHPLQSYFFFQTVPMTLVGKWPLKDDPHVQKVVETELYPLKQKNLSVSVNIWISQARVEKATKLQLEGANPY